MKSKSRANQNPEDRWSLYVRMFLVISTVVVMVSVLISADTVFSLSQNLISEAIGTAASILFIQRFLDRSSQKETERTNRMIKRNFNELKKSLVSKSNPESGKKTRKQRHSNSDYSRKKQNRFSKSRNMHSKFQV
jgi:hypothetical protein